jgi:glucose uptake protein GlcU
MNRRLAKWVVPAPLFRLLGGVYGAVAKQKTPSSDSTIAAFRRHVTIFYVSSVFYTYYIINLKLV